MQGQQLENHWQHLGGTKLIDFRKRWLKGEMSGQFSQWTEELADTTVPLLNSPLNLAGQAQVGAKSMLSFNLTNTIYLILVILRPCPT